MGWYNGRGYYGRRHGGGFFIFPLIFIGVMLLFFMRGFIFFFLPLLVVGFFAFVAFTVFRSIFGQHAYGNGWDYNEKRKNYFMGDDGEMFDGSDNEWKRKRDNDHIDYV